MVKNNAGKYRHQQLYCGQELRGPRSTSVPIPDWCRCSSGRPCRAPSALRSLDFGLVLGCKKQHMRWGDLDRPALYPHMVIHTVPGCQVQCWSRVVCVCSLSIRSSWTSNDSARLGTGHDGASIQRSMGCIIRRTSYHPATLRHSTQQAREFDLNGKYTMDALSEYTTGQGGHFSPHRASIWSISSRACACGVFAWPGVVRCMTGIGGMFGRGACSCFLLLML